jgi:methyltransferase-like protein/2-polyprenyl-3-methyl-5-hydroxy-6-metoxy-1,4-benzoquinol methylase
VQEATQTSYDQVPYPSVALRQTHPEQLSTLAALFGLNAANVEACRVLEIGCSDGANLIPMACNLPGSQFVGIDLSAVHIRCGNEWRAQLGLTNLTLSQLDVMDLDERYGDFDYIIAYGVFSWVPRQVQDKILQVCQQHLAPNGVAFVSYNTYPGWHMRGAVREMMQYHTRMFDDVQTRIEQGRALLEFLSAAAPKVAGRSERNKAYGMILENEQQRMARQTDSYLLHELLEEYNQPLYFHEFAERAGQAGLQYLSEAELATMLPDMLPPEVFQTIGRLGGNVVATEQYLDFVRNRMFRQTLLCRREIALERTWKPEKVYGYWISSALKPVSEAPEICSTFTERFRLPHGTTITSANPLIKAAFVVLAQEWPCAVSFNQLLNSARERSGSCAPLEADAQALGETLLKSLAVDLVELSRYPSRFTTQVNDRPCASAVARLQVTHNGSITNQRHETVELSEFERCLLLHLDGQHTHADLAYILADTLGPVREGAPTPIETVKQGLHDLGRAAMLVA